MLVQGLFLHTSSASPFLFLSRFLPLFFPHFHVCTMKSVAVALSLAACAFAQRLHVVSPTSGQTLKPGEFFTMELLQDVSRHAFPLL